MDKKVILVILLMIVALAGCASTKGTQTRSMMHEAPHPAEGEAAVFGKVTLMEKVNDIEMPANKADGYMYFVKVDEKRVYKVHCLESGEFGVYLPAGDYKLTEITFSGYRFLLDLSLTVPADQKAVYVGDLVLDASPAGVLPGSDNLAMVGGALRYFSGYVDTRFVYTVKDRQKDFEEDIKKSVPDADVKIAKVILAPRGGVITGYYPDKVYRSKDRLDDLIARTEAFGEFVGYVNDYLNYYISPIFFYLSEY